MKKENCGFEEAEWEKEATNIEMQFQGAGKRVESGDSR